MGAKGYLNLQKFLIATISFLVSNNKKMLFSSYSYYLRYHTHDVCGDSWNDKSCMTGEGACVQSIKVTPILKMRYSEHGNLRGVEVARYLPLNTNCHCEILHGSIFELFI